MVLMGVHEKSLAKNLSLPAEMASEILVRE
jgi:hypothetical protein